MPLKSKQQPPYYSTRQSSTIILNNTVILALPNTHTLIPTPGPNKYIQINSLSATLHLVTAYTNVTGSSAALSLGTLTLGNIELGSPFQETPGDWIIQYVPNDALEYSTDAINKPLTLDFTNTGDLTAGNTLNYLKFYINYSILTT